MALNYTETIRRNAVTIVNEVEVASHMMAINTEDPGGSMVCNLHIKDNVAYADKAVRDIIRANHTEFEDMAYALVEELKAKTKN